MSGSEIVRDFYERYFAAQVDQDEAYHDSIAENLRKISDESTKQLLKSSSESQSEESRELFRWMQQRFEHCIQLLDEEDRQMVTMRNMQQLTNREVAERLGITEPMASMRYLRAMRRLREIMSREDIS